MTYETVLLEMNEGIARLTVNQPKALNALSSKVLSELDKAIDEIAANDDVHVVIVTGAGDKAFVAGANIKEMSDLNAEEGEKFSKLGNDVFSKLANLRQPSIAAINGFALGGGSELALACDIRIGTTTAKMGQPEVGLGITPGFGGTQRLTRIVGIAKAKEMVYGGRNVDAATAEKIGLLNQVVEVEALEEAVNKMATTILRNAPYAVQQSKRAIDQGIELPLAEALELEAKAFGACFATNDQKEGMAAFIEKRRPTFENK